MKGANSLPERVRECAERIVESRSAALGGLYDLTAPRLVRYATTITKNQHDGEDAVHAALVRVADFPSKLASASNPWAYLLGMVRNEALQCMRKRRRWSFLDGITDLLIRRRVDHLELEDTHRAIWIALRALPADQSEVVVLKIWEGMTFSEIGSLLEVPAATCASRYRYALEKLQLSLQSLDPEAVDVI